jgi:hypothetical protein
MTTLNERLKRIKEGFLKQAPSEAVVVMDRATEKLRESGIVDRIMGVGSRLPAFELVDTAGQRVRSDELLRQGPLVLTFYRGVW